MPVHTAAPMPACPRTPAASRLPCKGSSLRSLVQVTLEPPPDALVSSVDGARELVLGTPSKSAGTGKRKAPAEVEGSGAAVSEHDFKLTKTLRTSTFVARRSSRITSTAGRMSGNSNVTSKFFSSEVEVASSAAGVKQEEQETQAPTGVEPRMKKLKPSHEGFENSADIPRSRISPRRAPSRTRRKPVKVEEVGEDHGSGAFRGKATTKTSVGNTGEDTTTTAGGMNKTKEEEGKVVVDGVEAGEFSSRRRQTIKMERKPKVERGSSSTTARAPPSPRLLAKASLIIQVMEALYPDPPIPIDHTDTFTLLCGVLLSAQTTDAQVNLVTKELFRLAPDPESMSKMSQEKVQGIIRSVGLAPTKAKHLIALSQQLVDRFGGHVPSTYQDLQSLPGVGRKTASVVMSQAFGEDTFPVDTHIHRLALRWGLTTHEKNANKVEDDLMWAFPRHLWSKLHLQLIYFGREHCQARIHDASMCPVCSWVKKAGPKAPKTLLEIGSLQEFIASPTPPKKSSKNAIVYSERHLELDKHLRMKLER